MRKDIKIDLLRVVASVSVVMLHTLFIWDNKEGEPSNPVITTYFVALRFCVPVFVMISGMLILNKNYPDLVTYYKKRFFRIVPGFIIFAPLYLLIQYFFENHSIKEIVKDNIVFGAPFVHLWFVYMIFVLYFFAPFLIKLVQNLTNKELLVLIACLFGLTWISEVYFYFSQKDTIWLFLAFRFFGYFVLGYYFVRAKLNEKLRIRQLAYILIYLAITYILFKVDVPFVRSYTSVLVLIQSLTVFLLLYNSDYKGNRFIESLSGYSYGIYLFHYSIFYFLNRYLAKHGWVGMFNPLYACIVAAITGYFISYLVIHLMNKLVKTG